MFCVSVTWTDTCYVLTDGKKSRLVAGHEKRGVMPGVGTCVNTQKYIRQRNPWAAVAQPPVLPDVTTFLSGPVSNFSPRE